MSTKQRIKPSVIYAKYITKRYDSVLKNYTSTKN